MATVVDKYSSPDIERSPSPTGSASVPSWVKGALVVIAVINVVLLVCVGILFTRPEMKAEGPEVYISSSVDSAEGFTLGGSLIKGRGEWIRKAGLDDARSDLKALNCGGKTLIFGGLTQQSAEANATIVNTTTIYDPIFEIQSYGTPMPLERFRFGADCYDGKVYIAGGFSNMNASDFGRPLGSMDIYDVAADSWTSSSAEMTTPRGDFALIAMDGKLYAFNGFAFDYAMLKDVEIYDIAADTWTAGSDGHTERGDVNAVIAPGSDTIYIVGGWGNSADEGIFYDFLPDVETYTPSTGKWGSVANLDMGRGDMSVVVHRNKIHVIGGEKWSGDTGPCGYDPTQTCNINQIPMHEHVYYDAAADMWVELAPIPTARFRFDCVDANDAIFVFGGHAEGTRVVADVEAFYDVEQEQFYYHVKDGATSRRLR